MPSWQQLLARCNYPEQVILRRMQNVAVETRGSHLPVFVGNDVSENDTSELFRHWTLEMDGHAHIHVSWPYCTGHRKREIIQGKLPSTI